MENRITKKVVNYQLEFKNNIKDWLNENNINIYDNNGNVVTSNFLKYIYDYDNFILTKDDLKKRKCIKSHLNQYERCCAKKANNEQCSRRKKNNSEYCGTHKKGTPYGIYDENSKIKKIKKIEIWVEEINGIQYYLDNDKNVYLPEDIINNSKTPRIIANWGYDMNGNYIISNI
jgi:hypothetical protein